MDGSGVSSTGGVMAIGVRHGDIVESIDRVRSCWSGDGKGPGGGKVALHF